MQNRSDFSEEIRKEFDLLSPFVQETILQSKAKFDSVEQLRKAADDIISGKKE